MTWTVYRWDDASAPTLTGQAGTYDLITVLDACLVTGYGAKAAAGWTKPYTGTGKAAFLQGTGSNGRYLRVDCSSSGQYPRLRSYDTMSDVDTGTNPVPTDEQISGGGYAMTSNGTGSTQRPWVVLADAKRFYLWVGYTASTATGLADTTANPVFFFGDFEKRNTGDIYNTLIVVGTSAAASSCNVFGTATGQNTTSATAGHYVAGSNAQVAGSLAISKTIKAAAVGTSTNLGNASRPYPDPVTGGMLLSRLFIVESGLDRGYLPGCYTPLHTLPGAPGDTLTGTTTGGLNGKTFILLNSGSSATNCRAAFETSDTV